MWHRLCICAAQCWYQYCLNNLSCDSKNNEAFIDSDNSNNWVFDAVPLRMAEEPADQQQVVSAEDGGADSLPAADEPVVSADQDGAEPQNYLLLILELQVVNLWFLGRIFVFQAVISQLTTKANSIMFWASPWRFVAAQWRSQMFVSSHWPCTFSSGFCQWICESLRLLKSQIVNCSGNWREEMVLPWQTCSQTAGVVPPNQDQSVSSWVWFVFLLKVD